MKILQFGEGNFLRAFVDYMIDEANNKGVMEGEVTVVKPIPMGSLDNLKKNNCKYTLVTRGMQNGEVIDDVRTVKSVKKALCAYEDFAELTAEACAPALKVIVSNTTEAGISLSDEDEFAAEPPKSYPAKLTKLLYERFKVGGEPLHLLPCELIENNGAKLYDCVMTTAKKWALGEDFLAWIDRCYFHCTLVDRIVTGFDKELSEKYNDPCLDVGEPFALWVIEDKGDIKDILPLHKAGLPVVYTSDVSPYRERKVRILNGAHTSTVLAAYLAGKSIVRECMQDEVISSFMKKCVYENIIPTLTLDKDQLYTFADQVFERFNNPFIDHSLLAISLNSVSKFKARLLGSFDDYYRIKGEIPKYITFAFAALIAFYCDTDKANDDKEALDYFAAHKNDADFIEGLCAQSQFWGCDLGKYDNFIPAVKKYLDDIRTAGAYEAMRCLG